MTYTSKVTYIDIETGEEIRWHKRNKSIYIILKTQKHVETNWKEGKCTIRYTKLCKRDPQQRLELS